MDRAVLVSILVTACSFTPGVPHGSSPEQPDASVGRPPADASTPSPDAPALVTTCHSQLPGVRVCLDFEGSHLSTDSSGYSHSVQVQNVNATTRGTQHAAQLRDTSTISIGDSPDLDMAGPLSMELWIAPTSFLQQNAYLVSSTNQYGLFVANGQLYCAVVTPDGAETDVTSGSSLPMNVWTHVACVRDGANLKLYVNGNGAGCRQQTDAVSTQTRQGIDIGVAMVGAIDDIHIYDSAITDADVCRLATGGTSCKPAVCN